MLLTHVRSHTHHQQQALAPSGRGPLTPKPKRTRGSDQQLQRLRVTEAPPTAKLYYDHADTHTHTPLPSPPCREPTVSGPVLHPEKIKYLLVPAPATRGPLHPSPAPFQCFVVVVVVVVHSTPLHRRPQPHAHIPRARPTRKRHERLGERERARCPNLPHLVRQPSSIMPAKTRGPAEY